MSCFITPKVHYCGEPIVWFKVGGLFIAFQSYDEIHQQLREINTPLGNLRKSFSCLRDYEKILIRPIKLPYCKERKMLVIEDEAIFEKLGGLQEILPFGERQCIKDFQKAVKEWPHSKECLNFVEIFPDSLEGRVEGKTLLDLAVAAGNVQCVYQLKLWGVDIDSKDESGQSPLELANSEYDRQFFIWSAIGDHVIEIRDSILFTDLADSSPTELKKSKKRRYSESNYLKWHLNVAALDESSKMKLKNPQEFVDGNKQKKSRKRYLTAWREAIFADTSNPQLQTTNQNTVLNKLRSQENLPISQELYQATSEYQFPLPPSPTFDSWQCFEKYFASNEQCVNDSAEEFRVEKRKSDSHTPPGSPKIDNSLNSPSSLSKEINPHGFFAEGYSSIHVILEPSEVSAPYLGIEMG